MNLKAMEYLDAVEVEGSFSKAADRCGVSQPALSAHIKRMEKELGIELIERTTRRVIFTSAGKEILAVSREILQKVKTIRSMGDEWADPYRSQLLLGAFPTLAPFIFPRILPELKDNYPHMSFYLVEEKTEVLIEKPINGEVDGAFIAEPFDHEFLEKQNIFYEDFYLMTPPDHQWSSQKTISADELKSFELLMLNEGHCLRDQALDFCTANEVVERTDFRASSLNTLMQMVEAGTGCTIIPEAAKAWTTKSNAIKIDPPIGRHISLFWRKSSHRKELFEEISDDLRKVFG